MRYLLVTIACGGCVDPAGDAGTEPTSTPTDVPQAGSETVSLVEAWSVAARPSYIWFAPVRGVGDVNGDGFDDVAVASSSDTSSLTELYLGSPAGLDTSAAWTDETTDRDSLGSPAAAGDVNGDGFGDVIFGNSGFDGDPGPGAEGRAAAFYGSASGLSEVADWSAIGEPGAAHYWNASSAGDVNGDGFGDVLVSDFDGFDSYKAGMVYGFLGSADGLEAVPSWTARGEVGAFFGVSVAGAGDVNGDGYDDVVIGAPGSDQAYVYLGSASGLGVAPAWVGRGDESLGTGTGYGYQVAGAGDVNGDGYHDVLVGAPTTVGTAGRQGRAHVVLGSLTGPADTWSWEATSHQDESLYGITVAGAGDLNGDGFHDVAIGAPYYDDVANDEGRVEVFLGSSTGVRRQSAWVAGSGTYQGLYGDALDSAGDIDGDGFDDLIVGAAGYENPGGEPGRVWAFAGGDVEE